MGGCAGPADAGDESLKKPCLWQPIPVPLCLPNILNTPASEGRPGRPRGQPLDLNLPSQLHSRRSIRLLQEALLIPDRIANGKQSHGGSLTFALFSPKQPDIVLFGRSRCHPTGAVRKAYHFGNQTCTSSERNIGVRSSSITVRAPARLLCGLLNCSGAFGRVDGGLGVALSRPQWELEVRPGTGSIRGCYVAEEHQRAIRRARDSLASITPTGRHG